MSYQELSIPSYRVSDSSSGQAVVGRIHSMESCGMVDGPGLRFVVFFQGCPLRCLYCHNPDSWRFSGGREITGEDVVKEAGKYKVWMDQSGGGLTLSGGEPLAQPAFALDIIRKAHAQKMHVALDSSGYGSFSQIQGCLDEADLVLLDIKTANPHLHPSLTGVRFHNTLETLDYLRSIEKPLWIRHVFVPGLTDQREDLTALLQLLKSVKTLERFELLPFHKMGEEKWAQIGERYTLTDTPAPDKERIRVVKERFRKEGIPMAD